MPLLLLSASLASVTLSTTSATESANGIIVASNVTLHAGDGNQFDEITTIETAQGHRVQILGRRGDWACVRTATGHTGWIKFRYVEPLV